MAKVPSFQPLVPEPAPPRRVLFRSSGSGLVRPVFRGGRAVIGEAECLHNGTCCGVVGACCEPGGFCEQLTEPVCQSRGGIFMPGAPCSPSPCGGACCSPNGTCAVTPPPELNGCNGPGYVWHGFGTTCASIQCSPILPCCASNPCFIPDPSGHIIFRSITTYTTHYGGAACSLLASDFQMHNEDTTATGAGPTCNYGPQWIRVNPATANNNRYVIVAFFAEQVDAIHPVAPAIYIYAGLEQGFDSASHLVHIWPVPCSGGSVAGNIPNSEFPFLCLNGQPSVRNVRYEATILVTGALACTSLTSLHRASDNRIVIARSGDCKGCVEGRRAF